MFRLATILLAAACATEPTSAAVDVDGLHTALHDGHAEPVLDVRTPAEFARGHVPGAINVPLQELEQRLAEVDPLDDDGPFYVICQSGARSARAVDILSAKGMGAVQVHGGTTAWIAKGYDVDE